MRLLRLSSDPVAFHAIVLLLVCSAFAAPATSSALELRPEALYEKVILGTLGGVFSFGSHIDDHGRVVGVSSTSTGGYRFFEWEDGVLRDLELPQAPFHIPPHLDSNNRGEIAGTVGPGPDLDAVLYLRGSVHKLGFQYVAELNDRGDVLGWNNIPSAFADPLVWENGAIRHLAVPGEFAVPVALNNRGEAVGEVWPADGLAKAIRWRSDGTFDTTLLAGYVECTAGDINDRGEAIGFCNGENGTRAFLWRDGVTTDLGVDSGVGQSSRALAINERGQILGSLCLPGSCGAFLWEDGVVTAISPMPGEQIVAAALNDRGQVVGTIVHGGGRNAFVWEDGVLTDLGQGTATDINERGEILGEIENVAVVWKPSKRAPGTASSVSGKAASASGRADVEIPRLFIRVMSRQGALPVEFQISGPGGQCEASVFDVQGRLVTRFEGIADGMAGRWDGRARDGSRASPGVYFLHVRTGKASTVAKLLFFR